MITLRARAGERLVAFVQRTGPLGSDGLLALAATAGSLYLTLFVHRTAVRVLLPAYHWHTASAAIIGARQVVEPHPSMLPSAGTVLLTLLLTVPLAWRRRWPLVVFGIQVTAMLAVGDNVNVVGFVAVMSGAYSLAVRRRSGEVVAAVLAVATVLITAKFRQVVPAIPGSVTPLALVLPIWLAGRSVLAWRVRAATFSERAVAAERDRETALRLAIATERGRIARDLHDIVSHNVSVMMIQSGAAQEMLNRDPDAAATALSAVQASGQEAMAELRQLLGVLTPALGDAPADPPLAPQPGLDQIGSLIGKVTAAGLPVRLHTIGQPRPLPPGADLTAYRVIQEALTNVLKHATGANAQVALTYRAGDLTIEVLDDGTPAGSAGTYPAGDGALPADPSLPGTGRGLLGLTERLSLCGGELQAGHRLAGGYRIRARIPVPAA